MATDKAAIEDDGGKTSPIRFTMIPVDTGLADQTGVSVALFKLKRSPGYGYVEGQVVAESVAKHPPLVRLQLVGDSIKRD